MESVQFILPSPVGDLFIVASAKGLQGLYLEKQEMKTLPSLDSDHDAVSILRATVHQLKEYFANRLQNFDIPLDLKGTDFQKKVWAELVRIPFGKTASYKQIAERIGNPAATRAVGAANGKNPVCIIVPCHRVVAADGSIGGYSGGLTFKRSLLDLEGAEHQ